MLRPLAASFAAILSTTAGLAATALLPHHAHATPGVQVADTRFELDLGGFRFDPLVSVPTSTRASVGSGADLRLVQFTGPTRPEWLSALAQDGVKVLQYIHPYSYVVWADASTLSPSANRPEIRWSGDFIAEYRVGTDDRSFDETPRPTMALVSRHADRGALDQALAAVGASVDSITPVNAHFAVAQFTVAGSRYMDVASIAGVYAVQDIEPLSEEEMMRGEMSNQSVVGGYGPAPGYTVTPGYETWLADSGYDGTGVIVGIVDGGTRLTHQDLVGRSSPCVSAGGGSTSCAAGASDHGTHVGAAVAGTGASNTMLNGFLRGQGTAPGAKIISQRYGPFLGSGPGGMVANGMLTIYRESALGNAILTNNSWGPTTTPQGYDIPTQQIDIIARDALADVPGQQPVLPVWSIMNGNGDSNGACAPASVASPDEAKNLFAVGSTSMQNTSGGQLAIFNVSSNSAHGNACDGRRIPHIVAPGCSTDSARNSSDSAYGFSCGTSMASPVVSGAVAVFIEKYRDENDGATPSPALVKAVFTAVAKNLQGFQNADGGTMGHRPDRFQGYGRLDLDAVINHAEPVYLFDQEMVFTASGQNWSQQVSAADPSQPIRIMLAWSDAPGHGLGGTTPAWVNNLDLLVTGTGGTYFGNVVGPDGWSATGGSADDRNNLEGVFLSSAQHGGAVTISVNATNIAADALNPHAPGAPAQDFALVCYNCVTGAGFALSASPSSASICTPDDATTTVHVSTSGGYTSPVTLSASSLPGSATASFAPAVISPTPGGSSLTISNTGTVSAGSYAIVIEGTDGSETRTTHFGLDVEASAPPAGSLLSPANGANDVPGTLTFSWDAVAGADSYQLQVATDASFGTLVIDETLTDTSFTPAAALLPATGYFWRVIASNACGTGTASQVFNFTTSSEICWIGSQAIPDNSPAGVNVDLAVGQTGVISSLRVHLRYNHTYVGDTKVTLAKVGGTGPITLIDRPGVPATSFGCSGDNVDATMDDAASSPVESSCLSSTPALSGSFIPQEPLAAFAGENLDGTWRLNISDHASGDAGTLLEWCLLAETTPTQPDDVIFKDGFESGIGSGVTLSEGFEDISSLPGAGWVLQNNSAPLGDTNWLQGSTLDFAAHEGAADSYIAANYENAGNGSATISNWLVTPLLTFDGSSSVSFWTRGHELSGYADRLEVRLCTGTPCTDVGTGAADVGGFTSTLLTLNETLDPNGYPDTWTQYTLTSANGLPNSGQGRVAFRYHVPDAGPDGSNANYIGIDTLEIQAAAIDGTVVDDASGITAGSASARRSR